MHKIRKISKKPLDFLEKSPNIVPDTPHKTMNTQITNLEEYGIEPSSIAGFLNEYMYTDRHSWLLYNVNGNTAMAVSVEREFKPEFIPGGFLAHCVNQEKQHLAPIKLTGTPFQVIKRRGEWGKWVIERYNNWWLNEEEKSHFTPGEGCEWYEENGYWCIIRRTKTGRVPRTFVKYGKTEAHCAAFHDYNF